MVIASFVYYILGLRHEGKIIEFKLAVKMADTDRDSLAEIICIFRLAGEFKPPYPLCYLALIVKGATIAS